MAVDYYKDFNFISKSTITVGLIDILEQLESGNSQAATQHLRVLVDDLRVDWNISQLAQVEMNHGEHFVNQ